MASALEVMKQQLFENENKDAYLKEMREILIAVTGESDIDLIPATLSEPRRQVAEFIRERWLKRTGELPEVLEFRKWVRAMTSETSLMSQTHVDKQEEVKTDTGNPENEKNNGNTASDNGSNVLSNNDQDKTVKPETETADNSQTTNYQSQN